MENMALAGLFVGFDYGTKKNLVAWVAECAVLYPGDELYVVRRKKDTPEKPKEDKSLIDYCKECSKEVDLWPLWKQRGADVTKFQGGN